MLLVLFSLSLIAAAAHYAVTRSRQVLTQAPQVQYAYAFYTTHRHN